MPELETPPAQPKVVPGEEYAPLASMLVNLTPKPDGTAREPENKPEVTPTPKPASNELPKPVVAKPEVRKPDEIKRENFAALEARAKKAEAEATEIKTAREAAEKRATDLEAALTQARAASGNVEGLKLTLAEREERISKLEEELRAVDIRRDPEFTEKFENGLKFHVERMTELGSTVLDKAEVQRLIRLGDDEKLAEVREALSAGQKVKWDAARMKIEELSTEKEQLLSRSEETAKALQERRRQKQLEAARSQGQQTLQIGRSIVEDIFSKVAPLADDKELREQCEAVVRGVSGFEGAQEWTTHRMMNELLRATVLGKITSTQDTTIRGLVEERNTLQEKVDSLERVLKEKGLTSSGDLDNYSPPAEKDIYDDDAPIATKLVVRR